MIARPDRIRPIFDMLSDAWRHARIFLNAGKTKVWNATGHEPPGVSELASGSDPVFVGSRSLAPSQQGLFVLGVPVGGHSGLGRCSSFVAFVVVLLLAPVHPCASSVAARLHGRFCPGPMSPHGGLLVGASRPPVSLNRLYAPSFWWSSAVAVAHAAYWALWADSFQRQAPELLQQVLSGLGSLAACVPCLRSASAATLAVSGPRPPSWPELLEGSQAPSLLLTQLSCPLDLAGRPRWRGGRARGAALVEARLRKECAYPGPPVPPRCRRP